MILTLYDRQHIKLRPLYQIKDLHIDSVLSTGDKTLSFLMPGSQLRDVYTEAYISTPNDDFVIKSITPSSNGWYQIQCNLNVEELESYLDNFESVEKTMKECLDYAFLGTGWHVGVCEIKKKRTIRRTNTTPWKIMQDARKTYRAEIKINSKDKIVDIYEHIGNDKGVYFAEQLNLKQLNKQVTSYDFYTQIKPIGANGLTIESINDGNPILSNHTYSKKDKLYIWTDQRYTVAENLKVDAQAKLDEMSTPLNAYSLQIIDLAKISDDYVDILSFGLGDTVTLMHESTNTFEKTRIVSLVEYPDEPNKNKCEVANSILKFEDIQQEMRDASDTINNVTTDNGTLDGSKVDSITTSQISDFDVQVQKVVDFTAIRAEIDDLRVKSATIQELAAALARIGTLEATSVTTTTLSAEIAKLNQAIIGKADITDLTSINGKITILESSVATLDTIVNRVTTSDSIHSLVINASTAVIDNAFLKSIVSSNITVNDLLAGDISTTRFKVKSDSGNLLITDNTIQISDTNRVRVQVGKDASGDYNMYVWDKSGNLMFDATGITAKGIQRPIIVNDMVSDNANISGDKINITSVIQKINANTTLIESSHILYDGKSLDVAFGKMETSVSTITSNVNTVTKTVTDNKSKWDTASTNATNALNTANTVTNTVNNNKSNWDKAPTALTNANNAQNTANNAQSVANSKAKVFSAQPVPPYQVGDLWVQGTSGVIMRCKTARASGSYTASDWEKADKYTDDTKANAVDTKVTTVTETVKSHSTQLTAQDGKISTLITDTTQVKKDITAVQGDVTTAKGDITTLQTNYSTLDQTVKGLSSTVGEHTSKITTVTNTVNNNKSNWDKALTALDNANKAQATANTANTNANNALKGIQNLRSSGLGIKVNYSTFTAANDAEIYFHGFDTYGNPTDTDGWVMYNGVKVTIPKGMWVNPNSAIPFNTLCYLVLDQSHKGIVSCWYDSSAKIWKFKYCDGAPINAGQSGTENFNDQNIVLGYYVNSGSTEAKFTSAGLFDPVKSYRDIVISPEATTSINTVNTRITTEIKTVSDKYASLQQDVNGFKTTVSSTYSTKTEVSKVKSDAATDATNKANQAKTDAINSANANTTTLLKSYSTTSAMNSAITQESNKITTAVASTYTTKAEFNALEIGGRNIATNTNKGITGWGWGIQTNSGKTITEVVENGIRCCKITKDGTSGSGWNYMSYSYINLSKYMPNKKYTVSFEIKPSVDTKFNITFRNGDSTNPFTNEQTTKVAPKNVWTKLYVTLTTLATFPTMGGQVMYMTGASCAANVSYILRNLVIEEGTKPSPWTPAPEDIDASIATVDGKFVNYYTTTQTDAKITTKANEITSNVSKTYATQATVNTINGDVSALKTWRTSAESKITDTAIVNTVTKSSNWTTLNSKATDAQTKANSLVDLTTIKDTRSTNQNPQWYFTNYPKKTVREFKNCTTIGVSGEGTYGTLETSVSWTESSGGYPVQLFYPNNSQNIYRRVGTSTTAWSAWIKVAGSHNIISSINQTAETIKINASKIDLVGKVSISMLDADTQTKVNNGNSAMSSINTNKANWDKGKTAYDWTNTNGGNMTNLRNMVLKWTNNAVSTSTYIQGGWIATNTITASQIASKAITAEKIAIGNFNNLIDADPDFNNAYNAGVTTINGEKFFQFGNASTAGYYSVTLRYMPPNTRFTVGDSYILRARGYKTEGYAVFAIRAQYTDGSWSNLGSCSTTIPTSNGSISAICKITNLPTSGKTVDKIRIFLETSNCKGLFYIRDITCYLMNSAELIVDGSITANKLNVTSLSAISANLGTVTAGNISGVKITGGSITSNTSINVTTDLTVGDNIYVGTNAGNRKKIIFTPNSQIWRWNVNSGEYVKMYSNMRTTIASEHSSYGTASVSTWVDNGIKQIDLDASKINIQGSVTTNGNFAWIGKQYASGDEWFGFYDSCKGNRKGYIGHAGSDDFRFVNIVGGGSIMFYTAKSDGAERYVYINPNIPSLYCSSNAIMNLGTSTYRYKQYFGSVSDSISSDRKLKTDFKQIANAKRFIMDLEPVSYKRIDGDSGRLHLGFIAQDVAKTAQITNMGDLSLYQASTKSGEYYDPSLPDSQLEWGLTYEEFIAPTIAVLQDTVKAVDTQGAMLNTMLLKLSKIDTLANEFDVKMCQMKNEHKIEMQNMKSEYDAKLNVLQNRIKQLESQM